MRGFVLPLMVATLVSPAVAQLVISSQDPRSFSFLSDPDIFYVRPGSDGESWFCDFPTSHPSNLELWQDEYCDAKWLELDRPDYDYHPSDVETSRTDAYWERMGQWMNNATFNATLPVWVVDDYLLQRAGEDRAILDEITSHALRFKALEYYSPAFLMRTDAWTQDYQESRELLGGGVPGQIVGVHVTLQNQDSVPTRGWGFVVVDEEVMPETYRGQVAAAWVHRRYGQLPVFLSPRSPDFARDTIWLTTGAAGIFYRPLAARGTKENEAQAIHLRGASTFMGRFGKSMMLAPRPLHEDAEFSLISEGYGIANVFPSGAADIALDLPEWLEGKVVSRSWYNPATDDNLMEPLTTATGRLQLELPNRALWSHQVVLSTARADTATTVSAIKPLME